MAAGRSPVLPMSYPHGKPRCRWPARLCGEPPCTASCRIQVDRIKKYDTAARPSSAYRRPRSGPHRRPPCRPLPPHCRLRHPRLCCRPRHRPVAVPAAVPVAVPAAVPVAAPLPSPLPRSRRRAHTDAALAGLASGSACRHQQPTVPNGDTGAPRKSTAAASATATAVVAAAAAAAGPAGLAQAGRNGGRMVPIIAASADANWCRVDRGDQYTFSHGSVTLPITRHAARHANTSHNSVTPTAKVP